jgi:hypothetical protein
VPAQHRRHGFYLQEQIIVHQSADYQQGIGWVAAVGVDVIVERVSHTSVVVKILPAGHVSRVLDDISESSVGRFQGCAQVGVGLFHLRLEVTRAHQLPIPVHRDLAGDMQELASLGS